MKINPTTNTANILPKIILHMSKGKLLYGRKCLRTGITNDAAAAVKLMPATRETMIKKLFNKFISSKTTINKAAIEQIEPITLNNSK